MLSGRLEGVFWLSYMFKKEGIYTMKKWLLLLPFICASTVSAYLTHEEVSFLKRAFRIPAAQKAKLDAFFEANPAIKAIFTAPKIARPVNGAGPEHWQPGGIAQGYWKDATDSEILWFRTTPNHNFPGSFDPEKHVWDTRQPVASMNLDSAEKVAHFKTLNGFVDAQAAVGHINSILAQAGLVNQARSNLIVRLDDHMLCSTWRAWTTYPQVFSRIINKMHWEQYLQDMGLTHLSCPEMYFYHIPGQPEDFNEENWIVIARFVESVSDEEFIEQFGQVPPPPFVEEVRQFCFPQPGTPCWKELVEFREAPDGTLTITDKRILVVKDEFGYRAVLINPEMPSIAGAKNDEERSMKVTTRQDGCPMYPYTAAIDNLNAFVAAAQRAHAKRIAAAQQVVVTDEEEQPEEVVGIIEEAD